MRNINEGLELGDLSRLVKPVMTIDEFKSKLGEDADICVLAFTVIGSKEPALDLVSFIEKGYDWVIDADASSGEDNDGNFIVFVEIERSKDMAKQINQLIEELAPLTGLGGTEWEFSYRSNKKKYPLSIDTLTEIVPLTSDSYKRQYGHEAIDTLKAVAGVKVDRKAPDNELTDSIRTAAGLK